LKANGGTLTLAADSAIYGGEAVFDSEGQLLGRLRSGGYGYTVGQVIGLAYLPRALAVPGMSLSVEAFGEHLSAVVTADVLYDPRGERIRA
jgi:glycine cleavage system aminomethyltransferase T